MPLLGEQKQKTNKPGRILGGLEIGMGQSIALKLFRRIGQQFLRDRTVFLYYNHMR